MKLEKGLIGGMWDKWESICSLEAVNWGKVIDFIYGTEE